MSNLTGFVRYGLVLLLFAPMMLKAYPISVVPGLDYYHGIRCDQGVSTLDYTCSFNGATSELGIQSSLIGNNGFSVSFEEEGSLNAANRTFPNQASAFGVDAYATAGISFAGTPRPLVLDITYTSVLTGFSSSSIAGGFYTNDGAPPSPPIEFSQVLDSSAQSESLSQTFDYDAFNGFVFAPTLYLQGSLDSGSASGAASTIFTFKAFEADGVTPVAITFTPEPSSFTLIAPVLAIAWFVLRNRPRR